MKYIKFYMRDRRLNLTLPIDQAEKIIDNPNQLVKLIGSDGKWSGRMINKSEIIGTERDYDHEEHESYNKNQLPEPIYNPFETERFKPSFLKGRSSKPERTPPEVLKKTEKSLKEKTNGK